MKDVNTIMTQIYNSSIAAELGRWRYNNADLAHPCIYFGQMPKEQTNFPQVRIIKATGDNEGRLVKFPDYFVTVVTKPDERSNGSIKGQDLARRIQALFNQAVFGDVNTYAETNAQFYDAEFIYTPVVVRAIFKEN